ERGEGGLGGEICAEHGGVGEGVVEGVERGGRIDHERDSGRVCLVDEADRDLVRPGVPQERDFEAVLSSLSQFSRKFHRGSPPFRYDRGRDRWGKETPGR